MGTSASARRAAAVAGLACVGLLAASCGTMRAAGVAAAGAAASAKARAAAKRTGAAASGGVVPWVDRPAPLYLPPAPPTPKPPAVRYAPCAASGLAGRPPSQESVGAGEITEYLVLTNVSGRPCTLAGAPSAFVGVQADGGEVSLLGRAATASLPELISPANLRPGGSALVGMVMSVGCEPGCGYATYTAVGVGVGGSGQVRVDFPAARPLTVPGDVLAVTRFGVHAPPPPRRKPSPLDVLVARVAMPAEVTAGSTVSYTVTLRNPTGHAVALRPCPSYEEYVAPMTTKPIRRLYYLNCAAAHVIGPHGSVTFAMRAPVPSFTGKARPAKYGWLMQDASVEAGGVVSAVPDAGS